MPIVSVVCSSVLQMFLGQRMSFGTGTVLTCSVQLRLAMYSPDFRGGPPLRFNQHSRPLLWYKYPETVASNRSRTTMTLGTVTLDGMMTPGSPFPVVPLVISRNRVMNCIVSKTPILWVVSNRNSASTVVPTIHTSNTTSSCGKPLHRGRNEAQEGRCRCRESFRVIQAFCDLEVFGDE